MKSLYLITASILVIIFAGCSKDDLFLNPVGTYSSGTTNKGLSDAFFNISASTDGKQTYANDGVLSIPINTPVKLSVNEFHETVKDVKWTVNGQVIASGNNAWVSFKTIGTHQLNASFKESKSGKDHNIEKKFYIFKEMNLSVSISPTKNICGNVAIGITAESENGKKIGPLYLANSVQKICTSEGNATARIARVPIKVYDSNTSFSIDLIEPNKTTSPVSVGFCFLFFCIGTSTTNTVVNPLQVYRTDKFSAMTVNHLTPGQYTSGETTLILE